MKIELIQTSGNGTQFYVLATNPMKRFRMQLGQITVNTNAVVADRLLSLQISVNALAVCTLDAHAFQVASSIRVYSLFNEAVAGESVGASNRYMNVPDVWLPAGSTIRVGITDGDAGDTFAARLLIEVED